jgi:hypothetical protein
MKAGGSHRIYPAMLSQIRNPLVRYGSAQPFHVNSTRIYQRHLTSVNEFFDGILSISNPGFLPARAPAARNGTRNGDRSSDQRVEVTPRNHSTTVPVQAHAANAETYALSGRALYLKGDFEQAELTAMWCELTAMWCESTAMWCESTVRCRRTRPTRRRTRSRGGRCT